MTVVGYECASLWNQCALAGVYLMTEQPLGKGTRSGQTSQIRAHTSGPGSRGRSSGHESGGWYAEPDHCRQCLERLARRSGTGVAQPRAFIEARQAGHRALSLWNLQSRAARTRCMARQRTSTDWPRRRITADAVAGAESSHLRTMDRDASAKRSRPPAQQRDCAAQARQVVRRGVPSSAPLVR